MTFPARALLVSAALWVLAAAPAGAQQAVRGTVIDDTADRGVPLAQVTLLQAGERAGVTATDEAGRFFLATERSGEILLEVQALGYQTVTSNPVQLVAGDTLVVEIRVLPDAILLEPLVVTERSNQGRNLFRRRQEEWGEGIFIGPEELAKIEMRHPGDIFRKQDDVLMRWGWGRLESGQSGAIPNIRTFRGSGCLRYMVDLVPVQPPPWLASANPWAVYPLDQLQPGEIRAVEIYRYVGEVPPEIRNHAMRGVDPNDDRLCGLVVIWTWAGW